MRVCLCMCAFHYQHHCQLVLQTLAEQVKGARGVTRSKQQVAKRLEGQLHRVQAEIKSVMEVRGIGGSGGGGGV